MTINKAHVQEACQLLAGLCDGANRQDSVGFNKVNSAFGKNLATIDLNRMTDKQAYTGLLMLQKYRKQLKRIHNFELSPAPSRQPRSFTGAPKEEEKIIVTIDTIDIGSALRLTIDWKFSKKHFTTLLEQVKKIPGRQFAQSGKRKFWHIPTNSASWIEEHMTIADEFIWTPSAATVRDQPENAKGERVSACFIRINKKSLTVGFSGLNRDVWFVVKETVKKLDGRFNPGPKTWGVPHKSAPALVQELSRIGVWEKFDIKGDWDGVMEKVEQYQKTNKEIAALTRNTESEYLVPEVPQLLGYQRAGVHALVQSNGRLYLCDDMGLGKTIQLIAYIKHKMIKRSLIVVPSHLKINWKKEFTKWYPEANVHIINGLYIPQDDARVKDGSKEPSTLPMDPDVYVINYYILNSWLPKLETMDFDLVAADEAHRVKKYRAEQESPQRSHAFYTLAKKSPRVVGLTGTPIENRIGETFQMLHTIDPVEYDNGFRFLQQYTHAHKDYHGYWHFDGSRNHEEFFERTRPHMLRRTKDQAGLDLPDRRVIRVDVPFQNKAEYDRAVRDCSNDIPIAALAKLRSVTGLQKIKSARSFLEDVQNNQEKFVIGSHHKEIIKALYDAFDHCSVLTTGDTSTKKKDENIERFQNDPDCLFYFGTILANNEGITLTAAPNMLVIEYPFVPSQLYQFFDRIYRIGQEQRVTVYTLEIAETIDEYMFDMLVGKTDDANQFIDGKQPGEGELSKANLITSVHGQIFADMQ